MARIFATKVWGLGAETWGALGFSKEGVRNNLAGEFKPSDYVLYVGTFNEPTKLEEQGRLLGLVKISSTHVATADLVEPSVWQGHLNNNDGKPKWPFGLPLIEAWRFTSQPLPRERDILPRFKEEGLVMKLATNYEELTSSEAELVLSLSKEKVEYIYTNSAIEGAQKREAVRAGLQNPGKGPSPILGKREVFFSVKESCTYCMELLSTESAFRAINVRLEPNKKRRVFKIGWSTDAAARQKALNFGFPNPAILGWKSIFVQRRKSQLDAYKLEQAVLAALEATKLAGRSEMIFCTNDEMQAAFRQKIVELTPSPAADDEEFVFGMVNGSGGFGE